MPKKSKQRLYWLAEIAEAHADRWRSRDVLWNRVAREAMEEVTEEEFGEVLAHLLKHGRVEHKPGRGQRDLIRRVPPV